MIQYFAGGRTFD